MQDWSASYAFVNASFPAVAPNIQSEYISLLDQFFSLLDSLRPENGHELANKVFAECGIFKNVNGRFEGAEEFAYTLRDMGTRLKALKHEVKKVFAFDAEGKEMMVFGPFTLEYKDGRVVRTEFVGRAEIVHDAQNKVRLKFFEGWTKE